MKVTFDFCKQAISIEGEEPKLVELLTLARSIAPLLSQIQITTRSPSASSPESVRPSPIPIQSGQSEEQLTGGNGDGAGPTIHGQTLRQFVRSLTLENAYERAAAIAYYIKRHENREFFSPKEMGEWFTHCGLQRPSQMPVAMSDAKRKYGYIDSAGYGKWRITTSGENLIVGKMNHAEESAKK